MATNLGTLLVKLNADSKDFFKGMEQASSRIERFAKETKRLMSDVAQVSGALFAAGAAATALAATVDGRTQASMQRLTAATGLLAVQVADVLEPAVQSLTQMFQEAAEWIAGLSPETKKMIADWALFAVKLAVAAKALALVFSLIDGVAGAFAGLSGAIAAVGIGPILGFVAALAAVLALVVVLHRAWRKNWGDIQNVTATVVEAISGFFSALAKNVGEQFGAVVDVVLGSVDLILAAIETLQGATGVKIFDTEGARNALAELAKDLKTGSFFKAGLQFAKSVAIDVGDTIVEEVSIMKKEISDALGLGGGGGGKVRQPTAVLDGNEVKLLGDEAANAIRSFNRGLLEANGSLSKMATNMNALIRQQVHQLNIAGDVGRGRNVGGMNVTSKAGPGGLFGVAQQVITKEAKALAQSARTMIGSLQSAAGSVGSVFSNIAQAAGSGGPWAAVFAAIMEVFTRMESFQKLLGILEYGLTRLGQFLEPLLGPIFEFIGALTAVATEQLAPLFKAFEPLFAGIFKMLERLLPIVASVGYIFEAVGPILELLMGAVGKFFEMLGPLFDVIGGVVKVVASVVLGFVIMLNEIAAALGDTKARGEADRLAGIVDRMWAPGANERVIADAHVAAAGWEAAAALDATAKAATDTMEELTNVPSGYKVALARFTATNVDGSGPYGLNDRDSGGGITVMGDMNVAATTESAAALIEEAKKDARRGRAGRTGNPETP